MSGIEPIQSTAEGSKVFDWDLTPEDLKLIDQQETQFLTQHFQNAEVAPHQSLAKAHQLQQQQPVGHVITELDKIRREKLVKEGEVSILRHRLNQLETEKYEASRRHASKLDALEQERQSMLLHLQRKIEHLETELKFQETQTHMSKPSKAAPPLPEAPLLTNVNGFFGGFEDLKSASSKRSKTRILKESSCETSFPIHNFGEVQESNQNEPPSTQKLLDIFYRALGNADFVFGKEDISELDRRRASETREAIQHIAAITGNIFLALEYKYSQACHLKRDVITHYILLVLEFTICRNPGIGRMIRNGILPTSYALKPYEKARLKDIEGLPACSTLLPRMCEHFISLTDGICASVVHQYLRIFKHVIYELDGDELPECIFNLIENGNLIGKLDYFQKYRQEILIDVIHLIHMMTGEFRLGLALVKQFRSPRDCSLLNMLNEVLVERLTGKAYYEPCSDTDRALLKLFFHLAKTNVLPASVVFEPTTLRRICRIISLTALNDGEKDLQPCLGDLRAFLLVVHHIVMVEKAPIVRLVVREFIGLLHATRFFSTNEPFKSLLQDLLGPLVPAFETTFCEILAGKYLPIPIPEVKRRQVALTEGEEIALYTSLGYKTP